MFEVRTDTRELLKYGIRLKLEDQPFSVLLALLENPGRLVTRAELQSRIWPDGTFVDFDKSLTKAVNKVRTVLDDSSVTPRFIETLSRRGYRFIAPVARNPEPLPPPAPPSASQKPRAWPKSATAIAAGLLLVLDLAIVLKLGGARNHLGIFGGVTPIHSLAVLPIVNLTGDAGQEYFADGLTDDLISDLARIGPLRVISYTSSMRYKNTRKALPEIARELNIDGVIEGSVQRAGGQVRINAKLIRVPNEQQIWSESYQRDEAEVAQLGGSVTLAVAHQISAYLTAEAAARLTGAAPSNSQAYDAYLHGRYLWNLRGRDAVTQSASYFEQAVREDPRFALAWSGLADSYTIGWDAAYDPVKGEQYARKAVALDPDLAEGHVSLGFALDCLFRWQEAGRELERGIGLNPNYVPGHQLYSVYLLTMGRPLEALAENDRVLQLDPFSLPANNFRGHILIGLRQYQRAEQHLREASAMFSNPRLFDSQLARIYWNQRRVAEALALERQWATAGPAEQSSESLQRLADAEAAWAKSDFRAACLSSVRWKENTNAGNVVRWDVPLQYGLLQDKQNALRWLGRFVEGKNYASILTLQTAPELDFLRSDPDFRNLLRQVGLSR